MAPAPVSVVNRTTKPRWWRTPRLLTSRREQRDAERSPAAPGEEEETPEEKHGIKGLPVELLWEIMQYLSLPDLKALRQTCKILAYVVADDILPEIFIRFALADNYVYCTKHGGWYSCPPGVKTRPCDGRKSLAGIKKMKATGGGLYSGCSFFQSDAKDITDPIIYNFTRSLVNMEDKLALATEVVLQIPELPRVAPLPPIHDTLLEFSDKILPYVLEKSAMLRRISLQVHHSICVRSATPAFLEKFCIICAARGIEIGVNLTLFSNWNSHENQDCLNALSGLTRLEVTTYNTTRASIALQGCIFTMPKRSPKLCLDIPRRVAMQPSADGKTLQLSLSSTGGKSGNSQL